MGKGHIWGLLIKTNHLPYKGQVAVNKAAKGQWSQIWFQDSSINLRFSSWLSKILCSYKWDIIDAQIGGKNEAAKIGLETKDSKVWRDAFLTPVK